MSNDDESKRLCVRVPASLLVEIDRLKEERRALTLSEVVRQLVSEGVQRRQSESRAAW